MKILPFVFFIIHHSSFIISANAQPISITLKDTTRATLRTDSANWNEAWFDLIGGAPLKDTLRIQDILVRAEDRSAEVLSIDSIGGKYRSHLALSVVLDNSGSMFHSYDSLTKYCDSLIDSLPDGVQYQVVTFDNQFRQSNHLITRRPNVFIAQSMFTDSVSKVRRFWHFYDSIRTQYTPLYDAIATAMMEIATMHVTQIVRRAGTPPGINYDEENGGDSLAYVLLVVTDGADNASQTSIQTLRKALQDIRVRVFAINYRTEDARLRWLVTHSGGSYFMANDLKELRTILRSIGRQMTRQYHVTYRFPSLGPSGTPQKPRTNGR